MQIIIGAVSVVDGGSIARSSFVVTNSMMSRDHATVRVVWDEMTCTDEVVYYDHSTNGTWATTAAGQTFHIMPNTKCRIGNGWVLQFGSPTSVGYGVTIK